MSISTRKLRIITALTALAVSSFAADLSSAQPGPQSLAAQPASAEVVIGVGKSTSIQLPVPYGDLLIAEPKIADVVPIDTRTVSIVGKGLGVTVLSVYGTDKRLLMTVNVVVSSDLEGLKARLHDILPNENRVAVSAANQSVLVSGVVSSPVALQQVLALAETYNPGKVVNLLSVQGSQQVMLSVRFVEMQRTTAKELRVNVDTGGRTTPPVTVLTGDAFFGNARTLQSTFGLTNFFFNLGGGDVQLLFDALEQKGLVKTLAEPTLTTMSGDTANFLAGGEFPIPIAQQSSGSGVPTITVEFKPFGISLAFTPTILQDGLINMVVNPEVSSIDPNTSITLTDVSIPGIKVRRAHTTVELRDGESFTIAGLLADNYQDGIRQFPFLGDLPIIGALFRSTSYQRDQTELVMVVTPHIVTPRRTTIATPSDQFIPPSDFELFLFGAERGQAANLRPEDRALISVDPSKGGVDGPFGHVLY